MASCSAPLIQARYNNTPNFKLRNGNGSGSFSSSFSCQSYSTIDFRPASLFNFFNFSGLTSFYKNTDLKIQGMSSSSTQGNVARPKTVKKLRDEPDHLLVLVHGIFASPNDWIYVEAELKKRLGSNFLIYGEASCKNTESLKRISFLAHSLGGLFARYAIGVLYSSNVSLNSQPEEDPGSRDRNLEKSTCTSIQGTIAGLEPINFITLATPHLGVRGRKQLPLLLGVPILEKLVPSIASVLVGRTGSQLFLTDGQPSKPPLLLRMASDCEDGNFLSALGAFRCRLLYANVSYDHMVGWRTSSIRRETELVQPPQRSLDGYKHVVDVDYCPPLASDGPHFPKEAAKAKKDAQNSPNTQNTTEYHEIMEEEMIRGLQRVGWKKIDVSFHSAFWPFFAHNNIHVKNEWFHNAGTGVIAHVVDSIKQQESSTFIAASL
ncbi:hypothetical protein IFM89_014037 [Coptis chinensis]|uniref:DUF676 domain-containing protein n=1 Tax=Coptis chinensis TaxID=261450 RepID=A0A835I0T0_9MAGN|nr:hypothetical protein IFM89_014037 [Coptis chinensis]